MSFCLLFLCETMQLISAVSVSLKSYLKETTQQLSEECQNESLICNQDDQC